MKRFGTITRLGLTAVAATLVLSACSGTADGDDTGAGTDSGPQAGGELVYLDAEIPTSAQVQESGTWQTRALQQNVTDRLIYRNAETYELEPWIAESWTVSDDGLSYEFVIRDGVTYSDGQELNASSVKKNLEWQSGGDDEKGVSANPHFPRELTAEADDASRTVTVTLPEPHAPLLNVLTGWGAGLVADATIDAPKEEQQKWVNLIGSGPFVVESEQYGKEVVLTKREGYAWAPESSENQGEAYLDTITWIPVQEDSVRLGTLKSGEGDVIRYVQPSEITALEAEGFGVVSKSGVGLTNHWIIRPGAPLLDDERVRRALFHAIDRAQILEDIYNEHWSVATGLLQPDSFGYTDLSDTIAHDPEAAAALLDEAGWTETDSGGYRVKDGQRLKIKTYLDVYDNTTKSLFQHIQAQFKELGIELDLNELDYASYWATAFADPEVGVLRVGWPHPDSSVGLNEYYNKDASDLIQLEGSDAELQDLLEQQYGETDEDARAELIGTIQEHLIDHGYALPILNDSQVFVTQGRVQDFELTDGALPEFYNTWVND